MPIRCSKCNKAAVTFIRYNGTHLCKDHFIEYFERRVKREFRKQKSKKRLNRIAVALSGGKDSSVALYVTHMIYHKTTEIHAITVDEGIDGYRDKTIAIARNLCKELGVKHHIVSFREHVGKTMDDIAKIENEIGTCTYCGVFRRNCLNRKAKELDADVLVMGHNLDDYSQSILMNFVNADLEKLIRLGPHERVQPGLIPRILPLRMIPEKEVFLYAMLRGLETSLDECPYALSNRKKFRDMINELERDHPGTRHKIVQSYEQIKPLLSKHFPPAELKTCKYCGEPAASSICKACLLKEKLRSD